VPSPMGATCQWNWMKPAHTFTGLPAMEQPRQGGCRGDSYALSLSTWAYRLLRTSRSF
jgi:hypothetical protein